MTERTARTIVILCFAALGGAFGSFSVLAIRTLCN